MAPISLPLHHSSEGLTIDILYRFVAHLLFDPKLLFVITLWHIRRSEPRSTALEVFKALTEARWQDVNRATLFWIATLLIASLIKANSWLSHWSRNNWSRSASKWGWAANEGQRAEVVVVTGGSGSLGREIVLRLAATTKAKIAILDIVEPKGPTIPNTTFHRCNLGSATDVEQACERIKKEVGNPTVLINNAGVVRSASILDSTPEDIDLTYDVNVKSHYHTVRAFLPEMIKANHGHVVTIASCTAYIQAAKGVSYASSKIAALSFHEGLSEELRHIYRAPMVRTSVILPGHIHGPMFQGFDAGVPNVIMPSLRTSTVASLVVRTVLSGESQFIIEPVYAKVLPAVRFLPSWFTNWLYSMGRNALGNVQVVDSKTQ